LTQDTKYVATVLPALENTKDAATTLAATVTPVPAPLVSVPVHLEMLITSWSLELNITTAPLSNNLMK
jgi:hypothetical protein